MASLVKEMPKRAMRKRTRAHVDPECEIAPEAGPALQRKRKGLAREPLEGLSLNASRPKSQKAQKKSSASKESTRRRRSSCRIACQNMLRIKAAKSIQQCFRTYVDHCLRRRTEVALGDQGLWCRLLCQDSGGGVTFLSEFIGEVLMMTNLSSCLRASSVCRNWRTIAEAACSSKRLPLRAMYSQPICPYVRSVMRCMREAEEEFMVSLYLPVSHDIGLTNRELFVSFLVDIQEKLVLSSVTLSLALNYVDRYMESVAVHISKLLVLGVTSLFLASKMWEVDRVPLAIFLEVTENTCTRTQVHAMEQSMLTHLDFKLSSPTAVNYLNILGATLVPQLPLEDSIVTHFAHYLVELSYLQRQFLEFSPSELAAAALYVGLEFLNRPVLEHCQKHFVMLEDLLRHPPKDVAECMSLLQAQLMAVSSSGCAALNRKFATSQFGSVSMLFDLDPVEEPSASDHEADEDMEEDMY